MFGVFDDRLVFVDPLDGGEGLTDMHAVKYEVGLPGHGQNLAE